MTPKPRRNPISRGTAVRLAARYGVVTVGWHTVPCHWCSTGVTVNVVAVGWGDLKVNRWTAEIDHLVAVRAGGTNKLENLVFSCQPCNASRGWRHETPPRLARKAAADAT